MSKIVTGILKTPATDDGERYIIHPQTDSAQVLVDNGGTTLESKLLSILAELSAVESGLTNQDTVSSTLAESLASSIASLETAVAACASSDDLDSLTSQVSSNTSAIETIQTAIADGVGTKVVIQDDEPETSDTIWFQTNS